MTVLVTGGGGFIGGAIVAALVERGEQVRSLARNSYPELERVGVRQYRGDLADPESVDRAVLGVDGVVHVGAKAGYWGGLDSYYLPNVVGTKNLIAACRRHGVSRVVFTSTPSVVHGGGHLRGVDESAPYPERYTSPYPATKAEAERMVLAANDDELATVALRPRLVWGPGDRHLLPRLAERAHSGRLRLVGDGTNRVDTTYVDNAVHAHLLALDRLAPGATIAGSAYFIAQGEPRPIREILNDLLEAVGAPPVRRSVSPMVAAMAGRAVERVWRTARLETEPPLTSFLVEQLAADHWYDLSAARRDLGYAPIVTFEQGLAQLRAHHAADGASDHPAGE